MCLTDSDSLALISPLSTETVKNDNEDDGDGCPANDDDGDDVMHSSDIHSEAPIFNGIQRRSVRIEAILSNVSTILQPSTQTSMTPLSSTPSRKRLSICKEQLRKRNANNKQLNSEVSFDQSKHTSVAKRNSHQITDYSKVCYTPEDLNPNALKFSSDPHFANYPYDSSFSSYSALSPSLKSDLTIRMNKNGSTNANDDNSKYNNNNNNIMSNNSRWQYSDTRKNTNQYTSPVQISCRANIMKKKTERQHQNKQSIASPMLPSLSTTPFSSQIKSMGDELSERRANQRKERSRLAAQIRRNREGQSLMLIQNALPISSYVLGLSLVHLNSNSFNSAGGITQPSSKNNELGTGVNNNNNNSQKKSNNSIGTTMNTTEAASTSLVTPPTTISSTPSAINLEKTGVLRIAGHTLFLLNKLSSYLGLHAKLSIALNSRSVYGMLIDSKELRIAYATPSLADAVGWPWIKLLGAPLHKLVKFTESSPNSKEITKKLLSKSHWSSLTTQSTFNATKNASISDSSYSPVTSNNNNNSPVNIESNNEFSLPEFITLSKLIPYKQPTLSTTKINKPDDINSKYSPTLPVNTRGFDTSFNINSEINTEVNSIKDRMEYKISNPHRLKRSDRCSTYNKYPLSSSVTGVSSSNATSNTISSGDNSSINNSDNLTFNDCSSSATKSFDQKTWINPTDNDNELICYCWTTAIINTLDGCSSELNQILDTLNVSDVNNPTVNNDSNNNIDDISKCLMDDGLLMDIITDNDAFSSDPLNFDSSWPRSPSSSSVTNATNNSCDFLDDFSWPTSTGLYLCLLQPINNYGSTMYPSTENTVTDTGVTTSKDNDTVDSDKLSNSSLSEPTEEEEKYDSAEKPDCLLPSTPCKSMNSNCSDKSELESSSLALSSPSLSTPLSIPTLSQQSNDCSQPKSSHCLTYLNFALKIETIEGNYQECFNVNEDSSLIGYSYLEFIHPDDLQQVINIFDNVTHTSSPRWISPYRISVPNENLNITVEKSFQWIRSLVFYNKVDKIFVCFHRFLGLCESTSYAVSCNQRLCCKDFENLLAQYQFKTNNDNQTPQVEVSQPTTCNTSNKSSANNHNQTKNRQTRSSHPSIRPVRMKSSTTNKKSTNTMVNSRSNNNMNNNNNNSNNSKPVKFFPIQSIRPIKQRLPQGCNQIVYANNPIKTIQFPLLHNSKNIRVPYSSYSNNNLYSSINSNNNNNNASHFLINRENSMNSVLNISAIKSSLHPNLSTIPYFSRSVLPVVSYKPSSSSSLSSPSSCSSSPPKRIVFLSSSSPSITMSTVPGSVKKFQSLTTFRYKNRTNNKNDRYTDYRTIIPCTTITNNNDNNNMRFTYLQMNNSYNQKVLIPETNQSLNTFETNGKSMNNGQCKPGDNLSVLTDNSSSPSHSGYSHDSSTSNCVSPNEFNLTDFDVNMQMEATVSELLASVPSPCKSAFEEDKIMQIDSNSSLYDSDVIQYDESSFPPLTDSNLDGEDFTGFQSDFINDSIILSG